MLISCWIFFFSFKFGQLVLWYDERFYHSPFNHKTSTIRQRKLLNYLKKTHFENNINNEQLQRRKQKKFLRYVKDVKRNNSTSKNDYMYINLCILTFIFVNSVYFMSGLNLVLFILIRIIFSRLFINFLIIIII